MMAVKVDCYNNVAIFGTFSKKILIFIINRHFFHDLFNEFFYEDWMLDINYESSFIHNVMTHLSANMCSEVQQEH